MGGVQFGPSFKMTTNETVTVTEVTEGNTGLQSRSGKSWGFTDFDMGKLETWKLRAQEGIITKLVIGKEICPSTGREHYQGYVTFKKSVRMKWLKTTIDEKCNWQREYSADVAAAYCMKRDLVVYVNKSKQGQSSEFDTVIEEITQNKRQKIDIIQKYPKTYVLRHAGLDKLLGVFDEAPRRDDVEVYWFYGVSGGGKTYTADQEAGDQAWHCSDTKLQWFDGYNGQENVTIHEIDPQCNFSLLLKLCDKSPVRVPIKGSTVPWRARRIWITKMEHPLELFKSLNVDLFQITRRMTLIREFPTVYVKA